MNAEANKKLDEVTINQLTWKHPVSRTAAVAIVRAVAEIPGDVYPDDVDLSDIGHDDRNVIGVAWRNLKRQGIIRHGTSFRQSKAKSRNGGTVFAYTLASRALAQRFLTINGDTKPLKPTQTELALS